MDVISKMTEEDNRISGLGIPQEVDLRVELQLKPIYFQLIPLLKILNNLLPSEDIFIDNMDLSSREDLKISLWQLEELVEEADTLQMDIVDKVGKISNYQRTEDNLKKG